MVRKYDYLIIGSGVAGMSFALKVAKTGTVALVCKSKMEEANTDLAQGGVATVTNLEVDNFEKHIHDTMVAGDWLSDPEAVKKVVTEAPAQIRELVSWGVDFDKNDKGEFDLHREGGHSEFRILHHADNTGHEIQVSLIETIRNNPKIDVFEDHFAVEILTQHHLGKIVTRRTPGIECYGAYVLNQETGEVDTFLSRVTLMATGGVGSVYRATSNPLVATGDGIAMVYRAKGTVQDMEFVQFHPTTLYHPGDRPAFLITEAMRGYGGVLRNLAGEEFMQEYEDILTGNEILQHRLHGTSPMTKEQALSHNMTGPNIRAVGIPFDIRKVDGYGVYPKFEFDVPVGENGDNWDRYRVRYLEIYESAKIIRQALDGLPEGDIMAKFPKVLRPPKGEVFSRTEGTRGELGFYIVSDGSTKPYRVHIRRPSFINLQGLDDMCRGMLIGDSVAAFSAIDPLMGEVDC